MSADIYPLRSTAEPHPLTTPSLVSRTLQAIRGIARAIARHHRAQRDYAHLLMLSDAHLLDIGLTRGELERLRAGWFRDMRRDAYRAGFSDRVNF
ncbi:MAG: DUF1127 domain-containing protein [Pseudomonadota bacterium]